jgi:hypothetical protein
MLGRAGVDAVVGEVEAALVVEDQIVRCDQRASVALAVDGLDLTGVEIDRLDRTTLVPGSPRPG